MVTNNSLLFRTQDVEEDEEEDYVEDPYQDSLSAAIAESAALAERERSMNRVESSDVKKRKTIKKDSYFSDEEDTDWNYGVPKKLLIKVR